MRTISAEQFKKQFGEETYNQFGQTAPKQPGLLSELKSRIADVGGRIGQQFRGEGEFAGQSTPRRATGIVAEAFSAPLGASKDVLPEIAEKGLEKVGEGVGKGLQWVAEKTTPQFMTEFVTKYPDAAKALEEAAGTVANVGEIAGDILGFQGAAISVTKVGSLAKQGLTSVESKIGAGVKAGGQLVEQGKTALVPKPPSPVGAVKQVLQGETKDVTAGVRGLKELKTTGVKTYSQLAGKVDDAITNLSKKVDDVLNNKIPVKLGQLKLVGKTTSGAKVAVDYVSRGLNHLKEMYGAIGDDISVKNITELIKKAITKGLTRKEVNDIARTYGIEFGTKAFGKTGEALTSVNARMFENTRRALKIVARQGMKGSKAEVIDKSISALFRVKNLVAKNVEAVNKLAQKIQERGLLEKVGYNVSKYADILTGGSLRGIMGGILPRGVGYKVMNALDLEKVLERNLKIIDDAIKAGDAEMVKILKPPKAKP